MANPSILIVDDDPLVRIAIERDLRTKYGRDYRIVAIDVGPAALNYLKQIRQRNEAVALFLVDQRMPQMTGIEFLEQAISFFPQAKKVLLTAYADTEAAIQSINQVGLDYYLMKPWDPPEERLYPVLDDLLEDWRANVRLPFEGIRLYGAQWCPSTHQVKDFLSRHQVPYHWLDIDQDPQARSLAEEANGGALKTPTLLFPDGSVLVDPSHQELAARLGLHTTPSQPFYDLVIIGSGPAGLAAAVYASAEGLKTLVIEKDAPGGQAGRSPKIENYLGFPVGIAGIDLSRRAMTQARRLGAEILSTQEACAIRLQDPYQFVRLRDGSEISCHAVLLATGADFNLLDLPGADHLAGAGVYYGAAYTEALYHKDEHVYVVGGANSAAQGALYLSRFASQVTVLIRGNAPTASYYLVEAMRKNDKIEICVNTDLVELHGQERLEGLVIRDRLNGETDPRPCQALFVFIGVKPQSDLVAGLVERNEKGYILTGPELRANNRRPTNWSLDRDPYLLETSVPGIFAAGDVRLGTSQRVASAAGEGGVAAALVRQYLNSL